MKTLNALAMGASLLGVCGCVSFADRDLVYSCTFDSAEAITSPEVGPAGEFRDLTLKEGHSGKALYVPAYKGVVRVPLANGLPISKGCIEFWAKLADPNRRFNTGADPFFYTIVPLDSERVDLSRSWVSINANNGSGASGFCVSIGACWLASRMNRLSNDTYATLFSEANPDAWHHYRLVWNLDGIADDPKTAISLRVDGKEVASCPLGSKRIDGDFCKRLAVPSVLNFPIPFKGSNHDTSHSAYLIDDFKIWKTDKTCD